MSEQAGEMPTPAPGEMPEATNQPEQPNTLESLQTEMEAMRTALKKANSEAAKYRKTADEATAAQKAKEEAELSEMEKLRKQLAKAQAETESLRLNQLKAQVAAEMGLPPALAARLQGNDEDELKADAKSLLEAMPKPATPPKIQPTNPANAQPPTETDDMRRARIYGSSRMFDPTGASAKGGGVVWKEK